MKAEIKGRQGVLEAVKTEYSTLNLTQSNCSYEFVEDDVIYDIQEDSNAPKIFN